MERNEEDEWMETHDGCKKLILRLRIIVDGLRRALNYYRYEVSRLA